MVSTIAKMIIFIMIVHDVWARPRPNIGDQEFNRDKNNGYAFDKVVHPSAPYQLPTLRKDPPVTRSFRTRGSKGSTNEEQCNIAQEQRCNEEDKGNVGGQVATDTKTKTRDDANECYFKHERLNPDGLEKNERPDHSKVSTECDNELRSFEELADSQSLLDLYGAENNADLALIRGAAEFGNDFDDETVKERMKNIFICKKHEEELVYRWKRWANPTHVYYKRVNNAAKPTCSVPNELLNKHGSNSASVLAKPGRFVRKNHAEAFLRQTGTHLQVGIAMCRAHAEHLDRWQIMDALEKDGLQVTPDVDYAGTASVEQSISIEAVMIGLPYGSISAKTSSGDKFEIDSTLRLHRNEHITQMYERYLDGVYGKGHEKGISRSAMWKILDTCSAHRKKAITGLDEFVANGRDAFDHIYQMLRTMLDRGFEDRDFVEMATKRLKESHQYLEGDYKLHVNLTSRVADHCITYALSDPADEKFASPSEVAGQAGSHPHDTVCDRCEQLKSVLGDIRDHVLEYPLPENEKERVKGKYLAAERAIMEMRRHQLRSVLSSNTRKDIVDELGTYGNADTLITLDWAMKWLPTKGLICYSHYISKLCIK
uniref:Uncharacterized protein n=1 Tax=Plectus sambesii TaxID=2011161 RepID=A0A914XRL7_9BILA